MERNPEACSRCSEQNRSVDYGTEQAPRDAVQTTPAERLRQGRWPNAGADSDGRPRSRLGHAGARACARKIVLAFVPLAVCVLQLLIRRRSLHIYVPGGLIAWELYRSWNQSLT